MQRVEKLVVDPSVEDIDALLPARRAHVHDVVAADEVATLDELDSHLPGEERVLEVGGVVDTRREQHHARVVDATRSCRAQGLQQP